MMGSFEDWMKPPKPLISTGKEPKRLYRGKWAGLSAVTIGKLLGCSDNLAGKLLRREEALLGKQLQLEDIGELIFKTKLLQMNKEVDKTLRRLNK